MFSGDPSVQTHVLFLAKYISPIQNLSSELLVPFTLLSRNSWKNLYSNYSEMFLFMMMMKQQDVIKYMRTWICSSVLYLLLLAVYLNQISFFSSTFISALVPGGFSDGEIIALSFMFLPAIFTFTTRLIFEEITTTTSVWRKTSLFMFCPLSVTPTVNVSLSIIRG